MSKRFVVLVVLALLSFTALNTPGQEGSITYQGSLQTAGSPANGAYDFQFGLFSVLSGGTEITSHSVSNAMVVDGIFNVTLPFGDQFLAGGDRFLEIRVRPFNVGGFATLTPRKQITSSPYSIRSINAENAANATNAATATNALQLGGVAANQYVLTGDARLSDARVPTPGSVDYIQNRTTQQSASNFNISGTGLGAIFNAATGFDIAGIPILRSPLNTNNTFLGPVAGQSNTSGNFNTYLGSFAGWKNTTGASNTFVGAISGRENTAGVWNTFAGMSSGQSNTTGNSNAYFGHEAGESNSTGSENSAFGAGAGRSSTASGNSYFGYEAGALNVSGLGNAVFGRAAFRNAITGNNNAIFGAGAGNNSAGMNENSFFGARAGLVNASGSSNTFVGYDTGAGNTTGGNNTLLGSRSNTGANNLNFATAIGAGSVVSASNTIALGRANGSDQVVIPGNLLVSGTLNTTLPAGSPNYIQNSTTQQAATNFNVGGTGTASIFNALTQYNISGTKMLAANGLYVDPDFGAPLTNIFLGYNAGNETVPDPNTSSVSGKFNTFVGTFAGERNTSGRSNAFFGERAGFANTTGIQNSFTGPGAGAANTTGSQNTFIGLSAGLANQTGSGNAALGHLANFGSGGLSNATAIGARARVDCNNCLVLGQIPGVNGATNSTNVGIGTMSPTNSLTLIGPGSTVGGVGGFAEVVGRFHRNVAGAHTAISVDAMPDQDAILYLAKGGSALWGIRNDANDGDSFQIRSSSGTPFHIEQTGRVGIGTTTPLDELHVVGNIRLSSLGSANTTTVLCRNTAQQIATCSSSSRKYKFNITNLRPGLDLVRRLRPVKFNWKAGGALDMGLVAEEVAAVEPLLSTYKDNGEIEGVKYDRIGVVLVNAVKEQQAQIESQAETIRRQQQQIDALTELVCATNSSAGICKEKE